MRGRTQEVVSPGVAANRKKGGQQKKPGKEEDEKPTAQLDEKLASVAPSPSVEKAAGRGRKAGKATTAPTTPAKKKGIGAANPVPEPLPALARGKKGVKKGVEEASTMKASSPPVSLPSNKKTGKAAFPEQAKKGRKQPVTSVSDEPAEAVPAAEAAPTPTTPVKKKGGKKAASSPVKIPPPPPAAAKKGASKAAAKAAELLVEPPVAGKKKPAAAKSTEGTKTVGTASKSKSSGKKAHQRVPSPVSLPVKRGRR
jgi:hypothetical protein